MNTNSLSPKQERKRQKIIRVAVKLFVQYGIQGTSMQLLAKRADIATGSIYNYFKNKETLISEIFQIYLEKEREFMLVDYDETASIKRRFEHLVSRSIQFKMEHPDAFQFRAQYVNTPGVMQELKSSEAFCGHPLEKVAIDGIEAGILKPYEIEELFYFTNGGLSAMLHWKIFAQQAITEEDKKRIMGMVWDAMAANEDDK